MQRCLVLLAIVVCALGLGGCVKSTFPLSSPDQAKADPRLVGVWREQESEKKSDDADVRVSFDAKGMGLVQAVARPGQKLSKKDADAHFKFFVTLTAHAAYLNVALPPESQESKSPEADTKPRYAFVRYEFINKDELRVWSMLSAKAFAKVVNDGKLHGRIKDPGKPEQTVYLEDPSEALLRFLDRQPADAAFEKPTIYRKVK